MKLYKYLLMLPVAFMAASCSDENKEEMVEETSANELKSSYMNPSGWSQNNILWTPGETIQYCFLNATSEQRALVKECMAELTNYANINFKMARKSENSHIRVNFYDSDVTERDIFFSFCSNYCGFGKYYNLQNAKNNATFTINPKANKSKAELKGMIFHELCHVLGLGEEIHNTNRPFSFNRSAIYNDFITKAKVSPSDANLNIDAYYSNDKSSYGKGFTSNSFDELSVMMWPISASWNSLNKTYTRNNALSVGDKEVLRKLYPYPSTKTVELFVGSDSKNDVIIGTWESFSDKSKIRGKAGFGYKASGVASTYPLYRCVHKSTGKVVYALKRGSTYNNGVNTTSYTIDNYPIAYVYDYTGYGRTYLAAYTNGKNDIVSFAGDELLIAKGYREVDCFCGLSLTAE